MPTYDSPGVYVEEKDTGANSISDKSTSVAAFIGVAPIGSAFVDTPKVCNSWTEFVQNFCKPDSKSTDLTHGVYGFFANGGSRCYVVNIGKSGSVAGDARKKSGVMSLQTLDEPAMVCAPGFTDAASQQAVLSHCELMGDRVAILDLPARVNDVAQLTKAPVVTATDEAGATRRAKHFGAPSSEKGFGACYAPYLVVQDPMGPDRVEVPPSGHVAGIYARTDVTRGVHKAPANMIVQKALGTTQSFTRAERGVLNSSGVNCIQFFPSRGVRVWGARTRADAASNWRYVNVRRLFCAIEEAIAEGTMWTVFEPNDEILRNSVIRDISAYLERQWRAGALVGTTPAEAFFVKCDAENNPPATVDEGQLIVDIGIAPVKTSEFIVFRIGQWAGGVSTQEQGGQAA